MILATGQDITSASYTLGGDAAFNPDDLIDYTFDTLVVSGTVNNFWISFVCGDNQDYVAIAGHNLGTLGCQLFIVNHGVQDVAGFLPQDDRPIMFAIPQRSGGAIDMQIRIVKQVVTDKVIISHVATGKATDLTSTTTQGQVLLKDYEAGYSRIPMSLGRKSKSILNQSAAPTATLIKTVSQKLKLNISNVATNFAQNELVGYQRFWTENAFFIQNDEDVTQTYMAMQFIPSPPKSHSQTRELVNLSYSFTAYNGL